MRAKRRAGTAGSEAGDDDGRGGACMESSSMEPGRKAPNETRIPARALMCPLGAGSVARRPAQAGLNGLTLPRPPPYSTGAAPLPSGLPPRFHVPSHRRRGEFRMAIQKVGVVGCGLMGSGIVQVCAQAGHDVRVREVDDAALAKGLGRIDKFLQGGVDKGKMTADQKAEILGRIHGTTRLADLGDRDLVIEAAIENMDAKHAVFAELDAASGPNTIFASNTSSLSITEMAAKTKRPARFVGLHFFNPVPLMKLVEVVRTPMADPAVLAEVEAFAKGLPKTVVAAQDTPGFVVNRLLVPFILDAIRVLESGIATKEDIDAGMVLGCGHPMGPLTLLDFVGLDTTLYIAEIMFDEFKEPRFAPPPLLKRMVLAGWHGRKSGRGFYDYSSGQPR